MRHALRILIAEDNDSDRMLLTKVLAKEGHQVIQACDGEEALTLYRQHLPDLILMDALMPKKTGSEAASIIKQEMGEGFVPIIFLTMLNDSASLAACLDAGGDDFLIKPYNAIILRAKINALMRMAHMQKTLLAQRDEIQQHRKYMLMEQQVAKRVFDTMTHSGCLNLPLFQYMVSPAALFNGDLLFAARKPSGGFHILLGDFTGHGLAAALGAMPVADIFNGMTGKGFCLTDVVYELNRKLFEVLPAEIFCAAWVIDLEPNQGYIEAWGGGMPDGVIINAQRQVKATLQSHHLPLGICEPHKLKMQVQRESIELADCIYIFSDGLVETMQDDGEMLGGEQLLGWLTEAEPVSAVATIRHELAQFNGGKAQDDDITLLQINVLEDESISLPGVVAKGNKSVGLGDWALQYELGAASLKHFDPLPLLLHVLMECPELRPHKSKLYTVLAELFSNSLDHGILGLSSSLKSTPSGFAQFYDQREGLLKALEHGWIRFEIRTLLTEDGGKLFIRVEDSGPGFDYKRPANFTDASQYSGRGIPLLLELCEQVSYKGCGNRVEAVFSW